MGHALVRGSPIQR